MAATANFDIVAVDDAFKEIFICIVGTDPSNGKYSYLDMKSGSATFGTLVQFSKYSSGVTSQALSNITLPIAVPAIQSARMYFAIGTDFESSNFHSGSGPSPSQVVNGGADVLFDKVEFDTSSPGSYNINPTNVDFYGITYTVNLKNNNGKNVTVGLSSPSYKMFEKFAEIPNYPTTNEGGNTAFYPNLLVQGSDGSNLRYLAPKTAAYSDLATGNPMILTQYLSTYVNKQVFRPKRQFTFYDKFYPSQMNQYWASVNSDGSSMTIYSDSLMQKIYCTIQPPSNPWGNPSFPADWHINFGANNNNSMDWGFTLIGNALVPLTANGWGINNGADRVLMALMISICRGVAHLDNGTTDWVNAKNYFRGDPKDHANFPIEYYAKIIHANALNGLAYAFSYDDIYSNNPSEYFDSGATIKFTLNLV